MVFTRFSVFLILITSVLCMESVAQPVAIKKMLHGVNFKTPTDITQYWVSEKLDGVRARWTGKQLLTRHGKVIHAPSWFTKNWPHKPLDGELWLARDEFQATLSCINFKAGKNQHCWQKLTFQLFDLPAHTGSFNDRVIAMKKLVNATDNPYLQVVKQFKVASLSTLYELLSEIVKQQGEGLMLHHQSAMYQHGRSKALMKLKQKFDAEAKVLSHESGKGKYQGMLGALTVINDDGVVFKIGTGFTDFQRKNPPPIGSTVTFQYIGKTKRGVPRFASFLRIRQTQ